MNEGVNRGRDHFDAVAPDRVVEAAAPPGMAGAAELVDEQQDGVAITYAELAKRVGSPGAVRAVGSACGANPAAVIVPCHRVLRSDGALGGYRWGLERKAALLEKEQRGQ